MVNKFEKSNGDLTVYALACGYVQTKGVNNTQIALWREGGPAYHVRIHDFNTHERIFWRSTSNLTEARRWVRQYVKRLKGGA